VSSVGLPARPAKSPLRLDSLTCQGVFDSEVSSPLTLKTPLRPPAGYTPLFAPPEVLDNVQNVSGAAPDNGGDQDVVATNGQIGNLGLTDQQETDLVNFLKTLTDGYSRPKPVGN
jgi:hypothetical protein